MGKLPTVDPYRYAPDPDEYRRADHGWFDELESVITLGAPHVRMGTRRIPMVEWLVRDEHYHNETRLRRRLVADAGDEVVAAIGGKASAAAEEAALAVTDFQHRFGGGSAIPDGSTSSGSGDHVMGIRCPRLRALAVAGTEIQEDLCIMEKGDQGQWRFTAGVVCFPTHWRITDKIGREQADIHGPVHYYADDLAQKVPHFFDRLKPNTLVKRRNWQINAGPLLFAPDLGDLHQPEVFRLEDIWVRSERQTLRRLPESQAVVFTIKVQQAPLGALVRYPTLRHKLAAAIDAWPGSYARSRGAKYGWFAGTVEWLRGGGLGG